MKTRWKRGFSLLCALLTLAGVVPAPASASAAQTAPDIPAGAWYADDAALMLERGMMRLNEAGQFEPGREITRAELCYALWKLAGSPKAANDNVKRLTDTQPDAWWYSAVAWSAGAEIVKGYSDNTFRPDQVLSRAQFAAFLCRYALWAGYTTQGEVERTAKNAEPFTDQGDIHVSFQDSVCWARAKGFINGYADKSFKPNIAAKRAHAAAILSRFIRENKVNVKASDIPVTGGEYLLAGAVYPAMVQFPGSEGNRRTWEELRAAEEVQSVWQQAVYERQRSLTSENANQMRGFFEKTMGQFLRGGDGKNRVFSPMNVYMALAMLAECGNGETRGQILSLLGAKNVETLREQANQAWNANYRDDGVVSTIFANSLWMNSAAIEGTGGQKAEFQEAALDTLKKTYFASVYSGDAGDPAYTKAFQDWLNAQTGGLLGDAVSHQKFVKEMVAALASTLYFRAKWSGQFDKDRTEQAAFHTDSGDVTCDFMRQDGRDEFYWGEKYTAVCKPLAAGEMWFLLPDEGVTPEELLHDSEAMDLLFKGYSEKSKDLIVHKRIPKFDVTNETDLIPGLKELGVTDVFGPRSDLTSLVRGTPVCVDAVNHAVRASIDEEGCTAVAFTVINMRATSAMPPEEEVDFTLDRPFLFCVTGAQNLPLFAGIVHNPAEK